MEIIKVFIIGWGILFGAIVLNFVATKFGIISWYQFLSEPRYSIKDMLWLFVFYPLFLGLLAYYLNKFVKF